MAGICNSVGGGVFLTCHRGAGVGGASVGGEYQSVGVEAWVVNRKQVDVQARSDPGCPGMR